MRSNALTSVAAALLFAGSASAAEILDLGGAGARITVLDASDVSAYVTTEDGRSVLRVPGGDAWELIDSPLDPEIANAGDGSFHPVDPAEVVAAVYEMDPTIARTIDATIYILPLPRRGNLDSSASDGVVYLSPGVRAMAPEQVQALVCHELGHVFHRHYLPDDDAEGWAEYRRLRGITDESIYFDEAPHKDRPHEIFAEDFRFLFGGPLARTSGSIENADLVLPTSVPGLAAWIRGRALPQTPAPFVVANFPDPLVNETTIRWTAPPGIDATAGTVRVFDAAGRLVRTLEAPTGTVSWDGRDASGRRAPAGVYYALISAGSFRATEPIHVLH
jgi:hypothetical protein